MRFTDQHARFFYLLGFLLSTNMCISDLPNQLRGSTLNLLQASPLWPMRDFSRCHPMNQWMHRCFIRFHNWPSRRSRQLHRLLSEKPRIRECIVVNRQDEIIWVHHVRISNDGLQWFQREEWHACVRRSEKVSIKKSLSSQHEGYQHDIFADISIFNSIAMSHTYKEVRNEKQEKGSVV